MRIELEGIVKRFGDQTIVNGVSLDIADGEFFFLLGPSGCGKTTLLRMLAGFLFPDAGEIRFGGQRMNEVPPEKRNTALVFQNYAVWPHLTVFENVAYGLEVRKLSRAEVTKRVTDILDRVHLSHLRDRKPAQLSGGQQQRIALARAVVVQPDLLLFDEPLSNLDAKLRLEMREEILALRDGSPLTALYVTHDQDEALSLADRIGVMHEGRLQQIGTPREIYEHPANPFVAGFIGEINLYPPGTRLAALLGADASRQCAFRPEDVTLGSSGVPALVKRSTYLGGRNALVLALDDGTEVRASTPLPAAAGETIRFTVASEALHMFPA
jgi:ABC-type Fe3+/spermidine/putrescine transport system ATPase subunit